MKFRFSRKEEQEREMMEALAMLNTNPPSVDCARKKLEKVIDGKVRYRVIEIPDGEMVGI